MAAATRPFISGNGAASLVEARQRTAQRAASFQEDWLTMPQAAELARVSMDAIKIARERGDLTFADVGGVMRASPESVREWARRKRLIA